MESRTRNGTILGILAALCAFYLLTGRSHLDAPDQAALTGFLGTWTDENGPSANYVRFSLVPRPSGTPGIQLNEGKGRIHGLLGENDAPITWNYESHTPLRLNFIVGPALVSWSSRLQAGAVTKAVSYLDWFPTFAHLAGAAPRPEWKLEGRDVWPLLTRQGQVPAPVLYWNVGNQALLVEGDWKLIERKAGARELYNLADDPAEKKNVAEQNPNKVEELRKLLAEQKRLDP